MEHDECYERDELIKKYIPLAKFLAKKFMNRRNLDDPLGLALETLIKCVDNLPNKPAHINVSGYINKSICKALLKEYEKWLLAPIKLKKQKANIVYKIDVSESFVAYDNILLRLEIRDLLESVIFDEMELSIIASIMKEGYTQRELAQQYEVCEATIYKKKTALLKKLKGLLA